MKKLAIILLFVISTSDLADDHYHFEVGVEDINNNSYYSNKAGEITGKTIEKIKRAFSEENYSVKFNPYPVSRLYRKLFSEQIDFKFPDNEKWNKEQKQGYKVTYSKPLIISTDGYFAEIKIVDFSKIRTIGLIRGFTIFPSEKELLKRNITITKANSQKSLVELLKRKRVEAIFCNKNLCDKLINKEKFEFKPTFPYIVNEFKISTIKYPEVIEKINNSL